MAAVEPRELAEGIMESRPRARGKLHDGSRESRKHARPRASISGVLFASAPLGGHETLNLVVSLRRREQCGMEEMFAGNESHEAGPEKE